LSPEDLAEGLLDEVEAVLAPEDLAVDHIARGAEHLGLDGLTGVVVVALLHGLALRLLGAPPVQAAFGGDGFEHPGIGDVALLDPHGGEDRAAERHRGLGAVVNVGGDDELGRVVAGDREELRLGVERQAQVPREARHLDQPVGLALGRALAQRQAAGDREHGTEIDRPHAHLGIGAARHGGEARVAQIGPRALGREVVVDDGACHAIAPRVM
jgi:hypothetical protein